MNRKIGVSCARTLHRSGNDWNSGRHGVDVHHHLCGIASVQSVSSAICIVYRLLYISTEFYFTQFEHIEELIGFIRGHFECVDLILPTLLRQLY